MASKFGIEIHRRLADHQPVDYIASKTGLKVRVIRWHRAGNCRCVPDGLEVHPVSLDRPVDTGPVVFTQEQVEALPWYGRIRYAFIAGLTEQELSDETGLDVRFIEAVIGDDVRAEAERRYTWAVSRVQEMLPARWLTYQNEARQRELAETARTTIAPELISAFFTEIIRHERTLLISAEFPDFIEWIRELAGHRHPEMSPVIEVAIKGNREWKCEQCHTTPA